MAGELIKFLDLTGIRDLEARCKDAFDNRLMADELLQLSIDLDRKSLELFGIVAADTNWDPAAGGILSSEMDAKWQEHFAFLEWIYDEAPDFWAAFNLDMDDDEGEPLYCIDAFGRQLVCALKQIHPRAALTFRQGELTPDQVEAAAEAWGRALLNGRSC